MLHLWNRTINMVCCHFEDSFQASWGIPMYFLKSLCLWYALIVHPIRHNRQVGMFRDQKSKYIHKIRWLKVIMQTPVAHWQAVILDFLWLDLIRSVFVLGPYWVDEVTSEIGPWKILIQSQIGITWLPDHHITMHQSDQSPRSVRVAEISPSSVRIQI